MPRRRPRSGLTSRHAGRDDLFPSLTDVAPAAYDSYDRRLWHPDPTPALEFSGRPARLTVGETLIRSGRPLERSRFDFRPFDLSGHPAVPNRVSYARPQATPVCVRRDRRRQVLHALGVAGRRGLRPPRRNETSSISCRK